MCLVAFYGFFRKSHLLPLSPAENDPQKQFSRSDFKFLSWGALVKIKWSKTIQFRERTIQIPLPYIPQSPLCPVTSILHAMSFTSSVSQTFHAFAYFDAVHLRCSVLTYRAFLSKLRVCLQARCYSPQDYAGHSFRRGGVSFAYQSGVPLELIKMLDDWKSDSVLLYLTAPLYIRLQTINLISKSVLTDAETS